MFVILDNFGQFLKDWAPTISAIATSVAAAASATAAFLIYRSRPVMVRTLEIHSEQVRSNIRTFMEEITDPPSPSEELLHVSSGEVRAIPEPQPYRIGLELHPLFSDLRSHLPKDVFKMWETHKRCRDAYTKQKQELSERAAQLLRSVTRLPIDAPTGTTTEMVFDTAIRAVLQDFDFIVQEREPLWFDLSLLGSLEWVGGEGGMLMLFLRHQGLFQLSIKEGQEQAKQRATAIYRSIAEWLKSDVEFKSAMAAHRKLHNQAVQQARNLKEQLQWLSQTPFFRQQCKIVRGGALQ